jgi:hypothetical protein
MSGPDLYVFTLKFLAVKKTGFSPIKNTFQNTGGPRLVRFLGPGKNRTVRNSY